MTQKKIKNVRDNVKNIVKKKWTIYINEDWAKTIIELCNIAEQSHKHSISGKLPNTKLIGAAASRYSKDIWGGTKAKKEYTWSRKDFIAGAQYILSKVACDTAKGE